MTVANIPLTYKRDELIVVLTELRPAAVAEDDAVRADYEKALKDRVKRFKAACRAAAKWTEEEMAERDYRVGPVYPIDRDGDTIYGNPCRRSKASEVDSALAMLRKMSEKRSFTLSSGGKWSTLFHLVTADVPEITTTCGDND